MPLFHTTAKMNVFQNSAASGSQLYVLRKWDAGKCLDIIERNRCTRFVGVPTMIRDMLEQPEFRPERAASLKSLSGGGAAMSCFALTENSFLQRSTGPVAPGTTQLMSCTLTEHAC